MKDEGGIKVKSRSGGKSKDKGEDGESQKLEK